jgi:thioredoxin-like negative regulator of GroEL
MLNAARQGDAHGNELAAIAVLEAGLTRHADATVVEKVPVLVYLAELMVRIGDSERAAAVLAELQALDLDDAASAEVATELAEAVELSARLS